MVSGLAPGLHLQEVAQAQAEPAEKSHVEEVPPRDVREMRLAPPPRSMYTRPIFRNRYEPRSLSWMGSEGFRARPMKCALIEME